MSEITVSPLTLAFVQQVAQIERDTFSDPWPLSVLEAELQNPLAFLLVAEKDGEVLGYVGSQIVPPEADMMNLAVKEAYRGQGIARRLLDALFCALRPRGVTSLTLEVRASNAPAIALYRALSFAEVGVRKNYYFHPREDALIFKKEL